MHISTSHNINLNYKMSTQWLMQFTRSALPPRLPYAISSIHPQQCSSVQAAKGRQSQMRRQKLRSSVNWLGTLKQKGIKHGLPVWVCMSIPKTDRHEICNIRDRWQ